MRDGANREYKREWLQYERQQPMYDESINEFYENVFKESPVHKGLLDEEFILMEKNGYTEILIHQLQLL